MKASRAAVGAAVLAMAALAASPGALAQRGDLVAAECITPQLRICRLMGGAIRQECTTGALAQMSDPCRKSLSQLATQRAGPLPAGWHEKAHGPHRLQKVEWTRPVAASATVEKPILLFIHGGGWSMGDKRMDVADKAAGQGWVFASTNYRLVPQVTVEQQAADVAQAIALLRRQTGLEWRSHRSHGAQRRRPRRGPSRERS